MEGGYAGTPGMGAPGMGAPGMGHVDVSVMEHHRMTAKQLIGQWVHCHSLYGTHQGILYKAMSKGILIINHTQLASSDGQHRPVNLGTYQPNGDEMDLEHVQFFPGPGLFLPYPALYGIYPRPGFFI